MRAFPFIIILLLTGSRCPAQTPWDYLRTRLQTAMAGPRLEYQYQATLLDDATGAPVDRLSGRLLKNGTDFLDSNTFELRVRQDDQFLKLDLRARKAYYGDVRRLARRHRLNPDLVESLQVPDSILARYAAVRLDSTSDPACYLVSIDLRKAETLLSWVQCWVTKDKLQLARLRCEYVQADAVLDATRRYRYRLDVYNIREAGNSPVDLSAYLTEHRKNPVLTGRYAHYKLIPIF